MDDNAQAIRDAIRRLAGNFNKDEVLSLLCTVDSVDLDARTCVVTSKNDLAELTIPDVSLMVNINDGFLIVPTVGSEVYITLTKRGLVWVSFFSSIDSVFLIAGDKIQLNDGTYGGLIKIDDLVSKINTLESDLNTLKAAFSSWVVVPNDGGAALKSIAASWYGTQITPTTKQDIENPDITHGPK